MKRIVLIKLVVILSASVITAGGCDDLDRKQEQSHDVAITNILADSSCVQGDTLHVVVTVENQGNCRESLVVKLINVTDGSQIGTQSVTLSAAGQGGMDEIADLILTGEAVGNQFGDWLAIGDVNGDGYDDLLITAAFYNDEMGRIYLYYGGTNMDENADMTFTGENTGDRLGDGDMCIADINNDSFDDVLIGARFYDNGRGRLYVYYGPPSMDENADITINGEVTNSSFGKTIVVGDVDGDGDNDLIVGANRYQGRKGRAYLYYGPIASDTTADKTFTGENSNDYFSHVMSARGDGDGCDDLLIGTRFWPKFESTGRAYLYYGGPGTTMDAVPDMIFDGERMRDNFASGVDLFDIDNDAYADVIIGARRANNNDGRGYLYWGTSSRTGMDTTPDLYFEGESGQQASMGGDSVYAGYVNNDNYGDIIFSGPGYGGSKGRDYLYYGNAQASMDTTCDHTFTGEATNSHPFRARIGDFNGDNYGDVVMGAYNYNNAQGRVWIYYNNPPSSTEVNFDWDTTKASKGEHTLKAEIVSVAGEEDTADNSKAITVNVKLSVKGKKEK